MTGSRAKRSLVVLAADADIEQAIQGLLSRAAALGAPVLGAPDFLRHPQRDAGCRTTAHELLRSYANDTQHALVVFDREGSGHAGSRGDLEAEVETRLRSNGWGDRAAAIAIEPEIEAWVWTPSSKVDLSLGWEGRTPDLRTWLREKALLNADAYKPGRPKEAMLAALRHVRAPQSPARFHQLGRSLPLDGCIDPSFHKFLATLRTWFGSPG